MTYDPNNIFAKILRGEIPSHKLYEDEDTFVFLDIMPRTEGHALVVTKEKARDLFDITPEALAKVMDVVQKLAPKIKEAVGADGVLITPRCADPLYRRSVRVSMGTVLQVPWTRLPKWPQGAALLRENGLTDDPNATEYLWS